LALINKGEKPKLLPPTFSRFNRQTKLEKNKSVLELDRSISKHLTKDESPNKSNKMLKIAENFIVDHKREDWLKRRNRIVSGADSVSFNKFLKSLFEALDDDNSDTIDAKELITHLLALGIAPEASYIEKALLASFNTDNIEEIQMNKREFVDLFKRDRKTDHILTLLNDYTQDTIKNRALNSIAKYIARSGLLRKVSNERFLSPKKQIIDAHSPLNAILTKLNTLEVQEELPDINNDNKTLNLKFCSMVEAAKIIEEWWSRLKKDSENLVNINAVTSFLTDRKFTNNVHEARSYILAIKNPKKGNKISKEHFERLFAKAVFKGALKNIAYVLNTGEFSNDGTPLRMKLAMYQRRLMLSGMNLQPGQLNQEGKQTLIALYNYTKYDVVEEPVDEIYRRMNTRLFKEERNKLANEIIQEKQGKLMTAVQDYSRSYMDKMKDQDLNTSHDSEDLSLGSHSTRNRNLSMIEHAGIQRSRSNSKRPIDKNLSHRVENSSRLHLDLETKQHSYIEEKYKARLNIRNKKFNYFLQADQAFKEASRQL
jgi:hypothetical protein